jgi:hypothetical protein
MKETCIACKQQTVSVIKIDSGYLCYNCYIEKKDKKNGVKKPRKNEEADIQTEFFNNVRLVFPNIPDKLIFAVPNGGSRNKLEAANLKRQGLKAGVSDTILLVPSGGYASLCIEFKTETGKQSEAQKEFQKQAETNGNKYVIVRSVSQAIQEVKNYLTQEKQNNSI